jgi:hypothetical protein
MLRSTETKPGQPRQVRWLASALALAAFGLAACGGDGGDENGAATKPGVDTSADRAGRSEEIVIKTRLDIPTGEVLGESSIGDSSFCPGGTFRDRRGDGDIGSVDRTFRCPDGSLRIGFSPGEPRGQTQAGPWKVVSGTRAFEGLRGDGRMKVKFESASDSKGRETFTGTVVP